MKTLPLMVVALFAAAGVSAQNLEAGLLANADGGQFPNLPTDVGVTPVDSGFSRSADAGGPADEASGTPVWISRPTVTFLEGGGPTGLDHGRVVLCGANTLLPDDLFRAIHFDQAPAGDWLAREAMDGNPAVSLVPVCQTESGAFELSTAVAEPTLVPQLAASLAPLLGGLALLCRRRTAPVAA